MTSNGSPPAGPTLGDRLSSRYFIITVAAFVAVGIPAYLYLARAVERQFVGNYADFSVNAAAHLFRQHLRSVDGGVYREPLTGSELDAFQAEVQEQVRLGDLRQAKVWRPDGMLLYSSDGAGVGNTRTLDGELAEAIKEGVKIELGDLGAEVEGEQSGGRVLEIYLPIRDAQGNVGNVFELYYGVGALTSAVAAIRVTLFAFLLLLFAAVAGIAQLGARLLVRRNRQLTGLAEQLARLAETDGLTGIANHRHFRERLVQVLGASERYGRRFSMVMVDLDFFKSINDTYGHQTGDEVLRETAMAMARVVRDVDFVARYGGEEFAVLMPETGEDEAVRVAERLRLALHDVVVTAGEDRIGVTASFGVAEFPSAAHDVDSLISAADSALYFSKKNGRDRVCAFSTLAGGSLGREDMERLVHRLRHASAFTIRALGAAVLPDTGPGTGAAGAVRFARFAGSVLEIDPHEQETLALAASVLEARPQPESGAAGKSDVLTPGEVAAIRRDPATSERIIAAIGDLQQALEMVRHHGEHFDGSGAPDGLRGEEIPFLSRVLQIVAAYNLAVSGRAGGATATPEQAVAELRTQVGTLFDPAIVERLVAAMTAASGEQEKAA